MDTQDVLAVRREVLVRSGLVLGFTPRDEARPVLHEIYASGEFLPRAEVERDATLLQPIPCAVVHWKNRILTLERQEKNSKHALHGRLVLWAGGHVDVFDATEKPEADLLVRCLERELDEEIQVTRGTPDLQGILFDGKSLHFAVVYDVPGEPPPFGAIEVSEEFKAGSKRSVRGTFVSLSDLDGMYPRLETWSKLILSEVLKRREVLRAHVQSNQLTFMDDAMQVETSG